MTAIIILILLKRDNRPNRSPYSMEKLPKFEAVDINGRKVKSSDFKGKNLYVQFINSRFPPDFFLFEKVYSKWGREDLDFLGIISDSTKLNLFYRYRPKNLTLIERDYYDLCSEFHISADNGFYFLVDKKGEVISSGKNDLGYGKGPKVFLQELILGDFFSISELIIENKKIDDFKWFSQVSNIRNNYTEKKYFIVSLFTKICDSCSGGNIIQSLNKIYREKNDSIYVLSILSSKFNSEDVVNFKSQLKISYPVILADNELNIKWNSLIKRYNEDFLTDICFIVDNSGKILKVAYKTCKCFPSFFNYMHSLVQEKK